MEVLVAALTFAVTWSGFEVVAMDGQAGQEIGLLARTSLLLQEYSVLTEHLPPQVYRDRFWGRNCPDAHKAARGPVERSITLDDSSAAQTTSLAGPANLLQTRLRYPRKYCVRWGRLSV